MINIYFNPDHPELAFSMATFIYNLPDKYAEEICDYIPIKTSDLRKSVNEIKSDLDNEIEIIWRERFFDSDDEDLESVKYAFFGIYPKTEKQASIIAAFIEENKDRIMMWVDWHPWPENLLKFLHSSVSNVLINETKTCLELMKEKNQDVPDTWLEAEKALITNDSSNPWAERYRKTFFATRIIGRNTMTEHGSNFVIFYSFISELLSDSTNEEINRIEDEYDSIKSETEEAIKQFTDTHQVFLEAKNRGRNVGCLILGEVSDCFNSDEVLLAGMEKYPWLCIVRYIINDRLFIIFGSQKLPIHELVEDYQDCLNHEDELLGILNAELLRFKE